MLARKALAGTAAAPKVYVEDVFSTYLYTGNNNTAQTITNNIDLSAEGGLIWFKDRSNVNGHFLIDTARGANSQLRTHSTAAETTSTNYISSFNNNGFTLGTNGNINGSETQVAWTFRKAKKFFDVVTYTGNGSNRTISHNLGSVPGSIFIKRTDTTGAWAVYHRSLANTEYLVLNTTAAKATGTTYWNSTTPTSTEFSLGTATDVNANGGTYVAYLFAHDAGGFGDAGSDSIIKCGSFTSAATTGATVTLDWEPQWLLVKRTDDVDGWNLLDNMRGWVNGSNDQRLLANSSAAEDSSSFGHPTATGFSWQDIVGASATYIYIAIRRGPMKTPTSGTEVFSPVRYTGTNVDNRLVNTGLLTDMFMGRQVEDNNTPGFIVGDRLRGNPYLGTATTNAELNDANSLMTPTAGYGNAFSAMNGVGVGNDTTAGVNYNTSSNKTLAFAFRRAPGFFDVVCYTGTGSATTFSHNLGVAPELIILKRRDAVVGWAVYNSSVGNTKWMQVNTDNAPSTASTIWNDTSPTSSVFSVGTSATVNGSGGTYVAYLFASVSGVSKVDSYTGNGSSVTVTTDFQPRFIMVKRTDSTGNWIVSDSASGLVAGSDPFMRLNSVGTETTNEDWVDVSSTGFTVNETTANANVNTGTYIYLCIA